jgi:hypothetical protein
MQQSGLIFQKLDRRLSREGYRSTTDGIAARTHLVLEVMAREHDARVLEPSVVEDVPEERSNGGGLPVVEVEDVRLLAHLLKVLEGSPTEVGESALKKNCLTNLETDKRQSCKQTKVEDVRLLALLLKALTSGAWMEACKLGSF